VRRLRRADPDKAVEVWAEDESRLGLKPVTRRTWSLRGHRPASSGRTRYEWLYVYAFARPRTGDTFTAILPRVSTDHMASALSAFAAHADPGGDKILVVVVDRAGWHVARRLAVPANVRLHFLPPCTPELQPVEPYWALVREAAANRGFDRLAGLRRVVRRRCDYLARNQAIVKGAVGFHWATRLET
jgi:hypothetical protein